MKSARLLAAASVFFVASSAYGQIDIPPEKICFNALVQKGQLAEYLMKTYRVSINALPDRGGSLSRVELYKQVLAGGDRCAAANACDTSDQMNLNTARGVVRYLLSGKDPRFESTADVSVGTYFGSDDETYAIKCLATGATPKPPAIFTEAPAKSKSDLRIRGKVDDLFIPRQQKNAFKGASQAAINFQTDAVADKRTATYQAVVGYAIETQIFKKPGEGLDLIPYAYLNTSSVSIGAGTTKKETSAEVYSFGMTASARWFAAPTIHMLNFRPDYLLNTENDSRIVSLNLQYIPIVPGILNSYRIVGSNFFSFKPVLDFRWNNGWYLEQGVPTPGLPNEDFSRIGGAAGITIVSDNDNIPLSFVSTYTMLSDVKDGPSIRYLSNTLTWSLDPDKLFGISGSYVNGRREDTGKEEQVWKAGLTLKF